MGVADLEVAGEPCSGDLPARPRSTSRFGALASERCTSLAITPLLPLLLLLHRAAGPKAEDGCGE